ncbi:MAG: AAA family ATPase [Chloroflexi bacterium]|nr:AAA family ATPase [Chloroflexota bacterium]
MPISDHLSTWIPALEAEIAAAMRKGGNRYPLFSAQRVGQTGGRFVYRFRLGRQCAVPDDAEVTVESAGQHVDGRVISVEEDEIVLALAEPLDRTGRATLVVKLWFILEQLRDRLRFPQRAASNLFDGAAPGAGSVIAPATSTSDVLLPGLNLEQSRAVAVGQRPGVWFVWGPPGTGKTRTLGQLAAALAANGRRVLVVTVSNDALDVAALAVMDNARPSLCRPGVVVRYGYPRREEVRNHSTLTPLAALRQLKPSLVKQYDTLSSALERTRADRKADRLRLAQLQDEVRACRQELRHEVDLLALHARILLCTAARLATSDLLEGQIYDTVIVDESSMVSTPLAAFASSYAASSVVYAGDFRQLPPVVLTMEPSAKRTLERSVFDHAGIVQRLASGQGSDARMITLAEQYRMTPSLAERVSRVFYAGQLRTAPTVRTRPSAGGVIVDIGDLAPYSQAEPKHLGGSRFNVVSALISMTLARQAAHALGGTVGVITPYRAQASLIRALAVDRGITWLRASTVHRYQGDEADIIVLDLTTAPGHTRLSYLLGGDLWSLAGRLVNVAVSRARHHLIVVADWRHLEDRWASMAGGRANQALAQVLDGMTIVRLTLDDVRTADGQFAVPSVPLATGERQPGPPPPAAWPILFREGGIFAGLAAHQQRLPNRHLLVAAREGSRPAGWVERAHDQGTALVVRGKNLHADWQIRLPQARFLDEPAPADLAVIDGDRFAISLRGQAATAAGLTYTLEVESPSAAPLVASLAGLVPLDARVDRRSAVPVSAIEDPPPVMGSPAAVLPPLPPAEIDLASLDGSPVHPPDTEVPDAEELLPMAVAAPSVCPVSGHRLILDLWPLPIRTRCSDIGCFFNGSEEVDDSVTERAGPLGEREAYYILAGNGLACPQHRRLPLIASLHAGLSFSCSEYRGSGCLWRRDRVARAIYLDGT